MDYCNCYESIYDIISACTVYTSCIIQYIYYYTVILFVHVVQVCCMLEIEMRYIGFAINMYSIP